MFVFLLLLTFLNDVNCDDPCNGWGQAIPEGKDCPRTSYRMRINDKFNSICYIPQPDCPPGLVSETPQDPDKEYDGSSLEIACVIPPTTKRQLDSSYKSEKPKDTNPMQVVTINAEIKSWMVYVVIGCTITVILFTLCVGSVIIIETIYSMVKMTRKRKKNNLGDFLTLYTLFLYIV